MASVYSYGRSYDYSRSSYLSVATYYPLNNGLWHGADNEDMYAEINLNTGSNAVSTLAVKFDLSDVPSGATISSVVLNVKARISNSSPYVLVGTAQLYSGDTAMGSSASLSTSVVKQTVTETGSWTYSSLQDLYLLITCTRGVLGGTNSQTLRFYGADVTVNYTAGGGSKNQMMVKGAFAWENVSKVYKKVNGSWVEQSDLANLFSTSTNYVKG